MKFLSVGDVLVIHENTMTHEGGLAGLRDPGLLESAVLMPQEQFGGEYLHPGPEAMAAAYLFHIAKNHPFHDGNKRTAVQAALVFIKINGATVLPAPDPLEAVTLRVASGDCEKDELTDWMREHVRFAGDPGEK